MDFRRILIESILSSLNFLYIITETSPGKLSSRLFNLVWKLDELKKIQTYIVYVTPTLNEQTQLEF